MAKVTEDMIRNSLRHIIDPDLNKDIVSLGFVKNILIDNENVSFDIELTTPACPIKEKFQTEARESILRLPGVRDVKVNMSSPRKSSRLDNMTQTSALNKVNTVIAISSCKGGVGKSTVAAYIALEVANRGFKVGLLDADIFGPSLPTIFGISNSERIYANKRKQFIPFTRHNLKLMSFGFLLKDAPAVLRGPLVSQYVSQMLHNTDWGELDYLFIDMPPGTGDVQITLTQAAKLNGAIIVTTRQSLSLVDVARGILMFETVKVPMIGIIENMSYFECDECHKKHYIFGGHSSSHLKERFGLDVIAEIPIKAEFSSTIKEYKKDPYWSETSDLAIRAIGKLSVLENRIPEIKFDKNTVTLRWDNGETVSIGAKKLRLSCQCAACVDEITGAIKLRESDLPVMVAPTEITPLGNYAIGVKWDDGHASSIYPYDRLKQIGNKI